MTNKTTTIKLAILLAGAVVFTLLSTLTIVISRVVGPDLLQNSVSVELNGLNPEQARETYLTADSIGNIPYLLTMRCQRDQSNPLQWKAFDGMWIKALYLHGSVQALSKISSVSVQVGPVHRNFSHAEMDKWQHVRSAGWALPQVKDVISLEMPAVTAGQFQGINMPGLVDLIKNSAIRATILTAVCLLLFLIAAYSVQKPVVQTLLQKLIVGEIAGETKTIIPFALGLLVVISGLALLYAISSYPFTQDDSFSQFLPVVIRSMETAAAGHFPVWNPYQLLGAPTTTVGTYALTYPPLYAAYWLAHNLLHNDNATIEIFCIAHLLTAYTVCYFALQHYKVGAWLAASGALCWTLSGWFLVAGRSQCNFIPYAVFLPLLIALINRLGNGVGFRWIAATGLSAGILFHAGHAEFWIYTMIFGALAVVLMFAARTISWQQLLSAAAAALVAVAVASPLLWLQKWETDGIMRMGGTGWPADLVDMLLPLVSFSISAVKHGSIKAQYYPEIFYAGTIFFAFSLVVLFLSAAALYFKPGLIKWRDLLQNQWLAMGSAAFVMSLGAPAVVWTAMSFLPIFNRFRWPIKYTSFLHIFFIFAAALFLERLLPKKGKIAVFGVSAALMLFHVTQCQSSLYDFIDRPYPALPQQEQALLKPAQNPGRIYCLVPIHSTTSGFVNSLVLNFPTEYKVYSSQGYDTFIAAKPLYVKTLTAMDSNPRATARAYGIEWLLWSDLERQPILSNPCQITLEMCQVGNLASGNCLLQQARESLNIPPLKIYHLTDKDPLVFLSEHPETALPFSADQSGLTINTRDLQGTLTANFLCWPWTTAQADGQTVPVVPDQWNRITVKLPQCSQLKIGYSPPWAQSSMIGLAILFAGIMLGAIAKRVK